MVAEAGHQPWVTLGRVGLLSWRLQRSWRGLPLGGLVLRVFFLQDSWEREVVGRKLVSPQKAETLTHPSSRRD